MRTVLVTGANGFIGKPLSDRLSREFRVHASVRRPFAFPFCCEVFFGGDVGPSSNWREELAGVDAVVHLAATVHTMSGDAAAAEQAYRLVNVDGTLNLARRSAMAGVRRFIFLSSVKVNGESTRIGHPFRPEDTPSPCDVYGTSKAEAEQGLREIAKQTGMEVVIIRPPLVYGPDVKGNFATMMQWLARGVPLPLGSVTHNRRSFVALDNLVDLVRTCLDHPAAANQIVLASDGEDLSTADLLRRLGRAMGRPTRLLQVPVALLELGAELIGKPDVCQRLCGSLQVDMSKTRELLNWAPPMGVDDGLKRTVGSQPC
jgi:nucleoside-diphosphate-sugar epimerase